MPRVQWRRTARQIRSTQVWRTRVVFWSGSILVGIIASLLAWGSDMAGHGFVSLVEGRPWLPFLLTPGGLIVIAWLTVNYFPDAEGSGIPQVIAMLHVARGRGTRRRVLSLGLALMKGLMIVLGLLCGASIGREGPTVHISAAISYSLPRFARFPHHAEARGLILAGAAAGLAAAFNTPLAGIVFAIEEMSRSFDERTSGTVLTAVILAGMIALALQGNYRYFGSVQATLDTQQMVLAVLICGFAGGLLGGIFSRLLVSGMRWLGWLRNDYPYLFAGACGLLLALIGLATAGLTFGAGYEEAHRILSGGASTGPLYPLLKLVATLVSYWSGIPGGLFAPSLSVGAGLGAELARWMPTDHTNAVALLGMLGYFTGVVQSPITAVVIVMEMTDQSSMLLPLMGTALVAEWVARHICHRSLYHTLADAYLESAKPSASAAQSRKRPDVASDDSPKP